MVGQRRSFLRRRRSRVPLVLSERGLPKLGAVVPGALLAVTVEVATGGVLAGEAASNKRMRKRLAVYGMMPAVEVASLASCYCKMAHWFPRRHSTQRHWPRVSKI